MPMRNEPLGETAKYARQGDEPEFVRNAAYLVDGLSPGEPIFVVRGNDATALVAMNFYLTMTDGAFSDDKTRSLEELRTTFIEYQRAHRDRLKLPD